VPEPAIDAQATRTEPGLEGVLERGLEAHLGRPVRVVGVESSGVGFSTHPIRRLRVALAGGEQTPVVFKRLRPKPDKDIRRELLVYRQLLAGQRFGAPALYASLCDEERGCYWLFLEDVGEWKLEWCEAHVYRLAFRWLARMHADYHGREEELHALRCLDEHGSRFYRALVRAARRSLREYGERRALGRFDRLVGRFFDSSVAHLSRQPWTLVHGDLYASNLIVQPGPKIRPVDWEWAAIGPAAWDVAKLISGWGKEKPRLLAAYLEEFELRSGAPLDRREFDCTLAHCRNMHAFWRLRWIGPDKDPKFVDGLLDKMERIWLEEDGGG
jgi:aminoglycoside/choline kinase family phosphotransferase